MIHVIQNRCRLCKLKIINLKSCRISFALYIVIRDVVAAGIIIIGVFEPEIKSKYMTEILSFFKENTDAGILYV